MSFAGYLAQAGIDNVNKAWENFFFCSFSVFFFFFARD